MGQCTLDEEREMYIEYLAEELDGSDLSAGSESDVDDHLVDGQPHAYAHGDWGLSSSSEPSGVDHTVTTLLVKMGIPMLITTLAMRMR